MLQRPLHPNTSAQKYRDTNGSCIVIQIGGVCGATFSQKGGHTLAGSIAIEVEGVSRYFPNVSGSGVNVTLLMSREIQNSGAYPENQ